MDKHETFDLMIIGGGPAGMAAALIAGRAMLKTVIINAEAPRNAVTTASHGFLTRDGAHPTELLAVSKAQLRKYETVRYIASSVTAVESHNAGFQATLNDGTALVATRVVIATGFRDDLAQLNLPGIEAVYGKSVYPCPFCDGFEHRHERLAVFGGEGVEHFVPVVRMWSKDIVVFTNGKALADGAAESLEQRGVRVVTDPVARLVSEDGLLRAVELSTGESIARDSGFIGDDCSLPATDFAQSLGVNTTQNHWGMDVLEADAFGVSNVPGVYIVGDAKTGFGGLLASAHEGASCIEHLVHTLAMERWNLL